MWQTGLSMKDLFDINGKTDEELLSEYPVDKNGRRIVHARLLDAIGERRAKEANRKPGDPGTIENPIFRNGKAYIYSSKNRLILWEDYAGETPDDLASEETESFVLTVEMMPTDEQKKMIQTAKNMPQVYSYDCPALTPERTAKFKPFAYARPRSGAESRNMQRLKQNLSGLRK